MSESSGDWDDWDDFISLVVMPICTIGVFASVCYGSLVGTIICLIIVFLGLCGMGYYDFLAEWASVIFMIGLIGLLLLLFRASFEPALCSLVCIITAVALYRLSKEAEKKQKEAKKKEEERLEGRRELEKRERKEFERKQKEKGLVKFVRGDGEEKWGTSEQVKEWRELDIGLSNNFADYTPREFEMFVGDLFRKMGYDVELTPSTGDYGVDVVAKKDGNTVAIQVKKYEQGNLIGTQVVQQTLGAMWKVKVDQSIIVTTSGFTVYAREQAKEAPIELWDKKALHEMVRKYMV